MGLRRFLPSRLITLVIVLVLASAAITATIVKKNKRPRSGRRQAAALAIALQESSIQYVSHVRPLLLGRCARCHGGKRQYGGLRIDSVAALLRGGESGPAVLPRNAKASPLIVRTVSHDMPQGDPPLTE